MGDITGTSVAGKEEKLEVRGVEIAGGREVAEGIPKLEWSRSSI